MFSSEEIKKYVEEHQEEAIGCLAEAIQSPSPTGFELPMAVTVEKWLNKIGMDVKKYVYAQGADGKDRPNFIADWTGSQPGKKVLFNGHMDTFPVTESDDPSVNPFSGEIKDGAVYGRGASDMKGGDCAAIMAVKFLKEMGFDPKGTITLTYMSDEENGGTYGARALLDEGLMNADFGISMEPSECRIKTGHGAVYPCKITVYGDGGSSAVAIIPNEIDNVFGGEDAIKKAMKAVKALNDLQDDVISKKETKYGTHLAVTKIHAGIAVNNYSRTCEICIDRRFSEPETVESVDKEICDALDAVKKIDPTFKYKFEGYYEPMTPQFDVEMDSDLVKAFDNACVNVLGKPAERYAKAGGCDIAYIHDKYKMPCIWFGPGHSDGVAGSYENCKINNYINCIQVYMNALVELLG